MSSYPGSFGAAMARTGMANFFLDLRDIPRGAVQDWFAQPHLFKWINSVYQTEKDIRYLFKLPEIFDAVIFIHTTSRARPLTCTGRIPAYPF